MKTYIADLLTIIRAAFDREARIANLEVAMTMVAAARRHDTERFERSQQEVSRLEALVALRQSELADARAGLAEAISRANSGGAPEGLSGMNVITIDAVPGVPGAQMADLVANSIARFRPGLYVAKGYMRGGSGGKLRWFGKAPSPGGNAWAIIVR